MTRPKFKIMIASSESITVNRFLKDYIFELSKFFSITVACKNARRDLNKILPKNVSLIDLNIERKINLILDLISLVKIFFILKKYNFTMIQTITPKVGLIFQIVAFILRVNYRIHIFTGQIWATKRGLFRLLLKNLDKIVASITTDLLADSFSQKEFLIKENIVKRSKIKVLANGSICGVDKNIFNRDLITKISIRKKLGIKNSEIIALFVGRLNKDKGIMDLIKSFELIYDKVINLHLVIVGKDEENITSNFNEKYKSFKRLHLLGEKYNPEQYMKASDFICLPSYREGFGLVVLEAAACGIPSVGSNIYGLNEVIINKKTGLLHEVKNVSELSKLLMLMAKDNKLRKTLGNAAFQRAHKLFSRERILKEQINFVKMIFRLDDDYKKNI